MSEEAMRIVEQIQAALFLQENVVAALESDEVGDEVHTAFERNAEPDFDVAMVASPQAGGGSIDDQGPDGFTRLWEDWTEAFESFDIELEEMIDAGDQVVSLVRLKGRTKTGGVDIEQRGAAVWTVRDGKLSRVEFHIDREAALRAAGLEPRS